MGAAEGEAFAGLPPLASSGFVFPLRPSGFRVSISQVCQSSVEGVPVDNDTHQGFDEDKIDEVTLALLYLVAWDREEPYGARAWKGFEWATLERLHQKGWISDPHSKAKSVALSEEGYLRSKEMFEKHFARKPQAC